MLQQRISPAEIDALILQLGLETLHQEPIGLLGRMVYRFRINSQRSVRNVITALEKKGVEFSAQPAINSNSRRTSRNSQPPWPAKGIRRNMLWPNSGLPKRI
jgi:hypothetical protein